jgi:hypothetical protein
VSARSENYDYLDDDAERDRTPSLLTPTPELERVNGDDTLPPHPSTRLTPDGRLPDGPGRTLPYVV